jgi:hypothetical protein
MALICVCAVLLLLRGSSSRWMCESHSCLVLLLLSSRVTCTFCMYRTNKRNDTDTEKQKNTHSVSFSNRHCSVPVCIHIRSLGRDRRRCCWCCHCRRLFIRDPNNSQTFAQALCANERLSIGLLQLTRYGYGIIDQRLRGIVSLMQRHASELISLLATQHFFQIRRLDQESEYKRCRAIEIERYDPCEVFDDRRCVRPHRLRHGSTR